MRPDLISPRAFSVLTHAREMIKINRASQGIHTRKSYQYLTPIITNVSLSRIV
jgi:hypothetical protein